MFAPYALSVTWHPRQLAQQAGRTFVETGANSGISFEAARWMVATRSASKAHTVSEGNSMPRKVSASAIHLRARAGNTLLEQCAHVVQSRPLTPLRNMANEAPWSPLVLGLEGRRGPFE
jgi:hypothetical protein